MYFLLFLLSIFLVCIVIGLSIGWGISCVPIIFPSGVNNIFIEVSGVGMGRGLPWN